MRNICFVINQHNVVGGRQKTAAKLCNYLKEFYNVYILPEVLYDKNTDFNVFRIVKYLKENNIELVILTSSFSVLDIWIRVKKLYDIKIIYSEHCSPEYTIQRWSKTQRNSLCNIASKIRIHFDSYKRFFEDSSKCYVIPNSTILKERKKYKNNNTFLYVGRLVDDPKNISWLLNEFSTLNNNWKLKIYGEDNIGINNYNNIEYMGVSYDEDLIYSDVDMLLCTSSSEGFGNSILEALNNSIPVLALDDYEFGVSKLVKNNINGFKCSKEDFKKYLEYYANNISEIEKMSYNCIDTIKEYDDRIQLCKWKELINDCWT